MVLTPPYLLFIGNATDPLSIKMAKSVADWNPEACIGEYRLPGCEVTTGCPSSWPISVPARGTTSPPTK